MFGLGTQELLIILAVVLIFFGGTKIPEIARGLGKGIKEFKSAQNGVIGEDGKNTKMSTDKDAEKK